jgi:spore coat polysaccharide biosynthesis protein SpsF
MRIGFLITARLKSTRLKQKILLDLNGKLVLDRVIDRCKATKGVDGVVLCTSTNPQDSALYQHALKHGIEFYIGSEDDVLVRIRDAAEYYGYDAFASITADNPLFCIRAIEQVIEQYKIAPFDFGFLKSLPVGCMPYFLRTAALKVACRMKSESDTEIWGPFVRRPDFFHVADFPVENAPFDESRRLTCDYPEDLDLLRTIYAHFPTNSIPSTAQAFALLQENPQWWKITETLRQRWPDSSELDRIAKEFDSARELGRDFADQNNIEITSGHTVSSIQL